jgi:hypothetical protein
VPLLLVGKKLLDDFARDASPLGATSGLDLGAHLLGATSRFFLGAHLDLNRLTDEMDCATDEAR